MKYFGNVDMDNLSDEEIDELYRPEKMNSRKSLAPLFVYLILKNQTDEEHHYSQKDIIAALEKEPYEIKIERKALSRILHQLGDSEMGIVTSNHFGFWYEKEYDMCA